METLKVLPYIYIICQMFTND